MLRSTLTWLRPGRLLTTAMILGVFAPILAGLFLVEDADAAGAGGSRGVLKLFELFGLGVALWRATINSPSRRPWNKIPLLLAAGAALVIFGTVIILTQNLVVEIVGVLGLAAYLFFRDAADRSSRAAAAVILAVGAQALFAPHLFNLVAPWVLPVDAEVGGGLAGLLAPGVQVEGTLITAPSGSSIQVLAGCSSLHNLSLTLLWWAALTMLRRSWWTPRDLAVLALAGLAQMACSLARLVLIASSASQYEFWHAGTGAHVFALAGSALAIAISWFGAGWAARGASSAPASRRAKPVLAS